MATKDVEIEVSVVGVKNVISGFRSISVAGARLGASFSSVRDRMSGDMARISSLARGVSGAMSGIGGVALAAGGALAGVGLSVGGVVKGLETAESVTRGVADEMRALKAEADGLMIRDPATLAGLKGFFTANGIDADEVGPVLAEINLMIEEALSGDQTAADRLKRLGVSVSSAIDEFGRRKPLDETFVSIFDDFAKVVADPNTRAYANATLVEAFGETAGIKLAGVMAQGTAAAREQIKAYAELADIRAGDLATYEQLNAAIGQNEGAVKGLAGAFAREYAPALTRSKQAWSELYASLRPQAAELGQTVGGYLGTLSPKMAALAEAIRLASTEGGDATNAPIVRLLAAASGFADGLVQKLGEVLDWLAGGDPAPWLETLITRFGQMRDVMIEIYDFVSQSVVPAVRAAWEMVSNLLNAVGVESTGGQIAIVAAFVLLHGTIGSVLKLAGDVVKTIASVAKFIPALSSASKTAAAAAKTAGEAGAAAGAARNGRAAGALGLLGRATVGVAAVAGSYAVVKSAADLEREMSDIAGRVEEMAAKNGEEFAAAYLLAFIEQVPHQFRTANVASKIVGSLGGIIGFDDLAPDFDGAAEKLRAQIEIGDPEKAIAGAAAAFRAYGWDIDESGVIQVGSTISIDGATFSAEVKGYLTDIPAAIRINGISGLEDVTRQIDAAIGGALDAGRPGLSGAAGLGKTRQADLAPVIINIPGSAPITGLQGTPDAIERLKRAQAATSLARS